jgi:1-acyl-sn-glycerol-3-phosphate acyltransferase
MDVTAAIRTAAVDRNVSEVAAIPEVRQAMVARQRKLAASGDVVAEGRDIGTVVFPDAEVKIFLTADATTRAHRRAVQREGLDASVDTEATTNAAEEQQILKELLRRDQLDSTREVSPLCMAKDAHKIDSTGRTLVEVVDEIVSLVDAVKKDTSKEAASTSPRPKVQGPKPSQVALEQKPRMRAFGGNSFDEYHDRAMRDYPLPARMLMGVAVGVIGAITKIIWPWSVQDGKKLWVKGSGRMIVMNHASMFDPVAAYITLAAHGIRCRFIYKSEFDTNAVAAWFLSRAGALPVERGAADLKAVRRATAALKRGECVLVFPEGTRIRSDEQPVTIHGGFALMAQLAHAPVQPLAIVGSRQITSQKTHLKRLFWRVYLKAGDPINFDEVEGSNRKEKCAAMERLAMDEVYSLRKELRTQYPNKS